MMNDQIILFFLMVLRLILELVPKLDKCSFLVDLIMSLMLFFAISSHLDYDQIYLSILIFEFLNIYEILFSLG